MSLRIRTVSERCKVPSATLRMWERRYGFPSPDRTGTNYRAYNEHDVEQILRVKALLDEGLSVSEAITRVRSAPTASISAEGVKRLRDEFFRAAKAMLEGEVENATKLASQGLPPWEFCQQFALPVFSVICDHLDIAQEHMASSILRQHMRQVLSLLPAATVDRTFVLACPRGDEHEGGLLAVAIRLRVLGQGVVVLGANTPASAIGAACEQRDVCAVGLSFVEPRTEAELTEIIVEVRKVCRDVPVFVGGPVARKQLRAVFAAGATYAESADEMLESLIQASTP
ncbi:MAG: MerR family transcriptional regulator [Deltaproteobacteria bacterium]|nr:MerR family transcriptional regulator [Deltaproteobacteria bacterium]